MGAFGNSKHWWPRNTWMGEVRNAMYEKNVQDED